MKFSGSSVEGCLVTSNVGDLAGRSLNKRTDDYNPEVELAQ